MIAALLACLFVGSAQAAEINGSADIGYWYLRNNVSGESSYIQNQYSLFYLGLRLDALRLLGDDSTSELNLHVRGKAYLNLPESHYTLGFSDQSRQEVEEASVEWRNLGRVADLWVGRQRVLEAGGETFDGLRGVFHLTSKADLGLYGGLGYDPRNYVGYVGPSYRQNPFNPDFAATGLYTTFRGAKLRSDAAVRTLLYKGELDRLALFGQATYDVTPSVAASGLLEADLSGYPAVRAANGNLIWRPQAGVTNTLSFFHWRVLQYKESGASAIPPPDAGYDVTRIGGTQVTGSSYFSGREHLMIRVFRRSHVFGAFQFSRRTFDDLNQFKYTVGYRDPDLLESGLDLKAQTDLIDNYKGFNAAIDVLLGRDFQDGRYRLEAGGSLLANERNVYENFQLVPNTREAEQEYSLRAGAYYNPNRTVSCVLNYAFIRETDIVDNNQGVVFHEIYLMTHLRF